MYQIIILLKITSISLLITTTIHNGHFFRHCLANSACKGITLTGGKYTLYKSSTATTKSGSISWIRDGDIRTSDGYHWDKQAGNFKLQILIKTKL